MHNFSYLIILAKYIENIYFDRQREREIYIYRWRKMSNHSSFGLNDISLDISAANEFER